MSIRRQGFLVSLLALGWAPAVSAQGVVGAEPGGLVALYSMTIEATLDDLGARAETRRVYSPQEPGAVRFYHPLPAGMSIEAVAVNGAPVSGEVLDAESADALRRDLVIQTRDPVFLRDLGTPMYVSDSIATEGGGVFGAGIEVTATLRAPLTPHGTLMGVDIPVDWHRAPLGSLSVTASAVTDAPLRTMYSPYHTLNLSRASAHEMQATYQGYDRCTAFDVTLLLATGDAPVQLDLLAFRTPEEEVGTWLGLLSTAVDAPEQAVEPRDIVLVVDRSGSMDGEKMSQARAALDAVLSGLRPSDRFAVVAFDNVVETFAPEVLAAEPEAVADARGFVEALVADGGTNIYDALKAAFAALPSQTSRARYVVFMTDGQATSGETDTDAIAAMARAHNEVGARIVTFGIGYNVNTLLLDRLALDSGGDALYITPGQPVDVAVGAFFDRIADPVVTNPWLDTTAAGGHLQYPEVMADLFAAQTVALVGRYTHPGTHRIVLGGESGGSSTQFAFDVTLPAVATDAGYAPRIWARRRVGDILQQLKLGGPDEALAEEAIRLARRYDVATDFTFFSLTDDGDMVMTWTGVSGEAVGAKAVETSASIDSYRKGGTVDAGADALVRYHTDRTYPRQAGWFTDTALPETGLDSGWTDLHLGSEQFWALVAAEQHLGIGGELSVGANLRLSSRGRRLRVTDPTAPPESGLPPESASVPAAPPIPEAGTTAVVPVAPEAAPAAPIPEAPAIPTGAVAGEYAPGCTSTPAPTAPWSALLLLMALAALARSRAR